MTEMNAHTSPSPSAVNTSLLRDAQRLLFRPGVQLRMTMAILICLFTVLFPLMMPIGGVLLLIPFEIFVTLPMLYGFAVMAERAASGEPISIRDLFAAFSRKYWYALRTILTVLFFAALPLLLLLAIGIGIGTVYTLALSTPATSAYAVFVLIFCIALSPIAILPVLSLEMPVYFLLAIRVKHFGTPIFKAMRQSVRLLSRGFGAYVRLQIKYLGLTLLSVLSVCVLFPIYTVPLISIMTALQLTRLTEESVPTL